MYSREEVNRLIIKAFESNRFTKAIQKCWIKENL